MVEFQVITIPVGIHVHVGDPGNVVPVKHSKDEGAVRIRGTMSTSELATHMQCMMTGDI